jgi:inosine-uridine nucleoside N-ribohydrolase
MSSKPLMMDVDTGVDDAAAIAMALGLEVDLVAISTVAGNVSIDHSTANTLRVLSLLGGEDVPVFRGASRPLVAPLQFAPYVHGEDGLAGAQLPEAVTDEQELTAPEAIVAMAEGFDGELTFVSVGPVTNLAMALSLRPQIARQIARVVIMGGAYFVPGNTSSYGEFNAYLDPDALHQVFQAEWNEIIAVGLDVTHQTSLNRAMWEGISEDADGAAGMMRGIARSTFVEGLRPTFYLHDPLALAVALDPALVTTGEYVVSVEPHGERRGQTVVGEPGRIKIATAVDSERFERRFCGALGIRYVASKASAT